IRNRAMTTMSRTDRRTVVLGPREVLVMVAPNGWSQGVTTSRIASRAYPSRHAAVCIMANLLCPSPPSPRASTGSRPASRHHLGRGGSSCGKGDKQCLPLPLGGLVPRGILALLGLAVRDAVEDGSQ